LHHEEEEGTRKLSEYGASLIKDGFTILTHCNTGPLATTGYAQTGAMTPEQMKTMSDQMKGGKMTADQMKMMGEHMQMMADRMKEGRMTPDQMKKMNGVRISEAL